MIAVSILNIKEDLEKIKKIDLLHPDFLHIDVMDGQFVSNQTDFLELPDMVTKRDVHLMVKDIYTYVEKYKKYSPEYITFHIEATDSIEEMVDYIHSIGSKVGISIKPNTKVEELLPYLSKIDLVLVMSVEPGLGGQAFIESSVEKIDALAYLRKENHYHYVIEVDGGINPITKEKCHNADIFVVGSYITMSENSALKLKEMMK